MVLDVRATSVMRRGSMIFQANSLAAAVGSCGSESVVAGIRLASGRGGRSEREPTVDSRRNSDRDGMD